MKNYKNWIIEISQTDTYCQATIRPNGGQPQPIRPITESVSRRWNYADYTAGYWPASAEAQADMFTWISDIYDSVGDRRPTADLPK